MRNTRTKTRGVALSVSLFAVAIAAGLLSVFALSIGMVTMVWMQRYQTFLAQFN